MSPIDHFVSKLDYFGMDERIETNLAYMQNQLAELNEIVTSLQAQVTRLEKQNEFLNKKLVKLNIAQIKQAIFTVLSAKRPLKATN